MATQEPTSGSERSQRLGGLVVSGVAGETSGCSGTRPGPT